MAVTKVIDDVGAAYIIGKIKVAQDTADSKVDKVDGKGLSTNDFTDDLKDKLENLSDGETIYTPKGGVPKVEDLPQPPDVEPGDIYQVDDDTVMTDDGTKKTYKTLDGTVENYTDLPTDPADITTGAIYRVRNPYTDNSTTPPTDYDANSLWTATNDGTTVTWENLTGAVVLPAGTDFKYTDDDGYIPIQNQIDLSEYLKKDEVVPIPIADIEAMFA